MSQELERIDESLVATVLPPETNLLAVVARAASDPTVDVEKMKALLEMHREMSRDHAAVEFKAALARVQAVMPRVEKFGQIAVGGSVRSTFARYEDVDRAIRPLLAAEGFSVDFDTSEAEKCLRVTLRVSHRAGHSEERNIVLPMDASGSKNPVQGVGSTFSYGKRYLLSNFFNVITSDDPSDNDGHGDTITQDQQIVIADLLRETGANRAKFLEFMGASSIDAIPVSQYSKAVNALERKRK